jgi:hypothetical protein
MQIINTNLISHPMNWIVILFMLVLASIAGHFFLAYLGVEPAA